jgi:prepilin-type N-terminal cleavage/methylation domain-containing protein/prepilin-type processing-associated H-X9-DG protein
MNNCQNELKRTELRQYPNGARPGQADGLGNEVKPKSRKPLRRNGFTLVELLVVIAIIAILAAMLLPALSSAKQTAKAIKCSSNLKQLGTVIGFYESDYNEYIIPYRHYFVGSVPDWRYYYYYLIEGAGYDYNKVITPSLETNVYCPSDTDPGVVGGGSGYLSSYGPNRAVMTDTSNPGTNSNYMAQRKISRIKDPSTGICMGDAKKGGASIISSTSSTVSVNVSDLAYGLRHNNKRALNGLFLDGHVESVSSRTIQSVNTLGVNSPLAQHPSVFY